MTAADIAHMIAQIGKVPSLETQAITQEILDAFNERIASLERQVRALKLQARPWKAFTPQRDQTEAEFLGVIPSNAKLDESRQPGKRKRK